MQGISYRAVRFSSEFAPMALGAIDALQRDHELCLYLVGSLSTFTAHQILMHDTQIDPHVSRLYHVVCHTTR
jgi:hypothetical protein